MLKSIIYFLMFNVVFHSAFICFILISVSYYDWVVGAIRTYTLISFYLCQRLESTRMDN